MTVAHILGFPRIGARREWQFAVASYREGASTLADLQATGAQLRRRHWAQQAEAGLDFVTVGDFARYDQVLDMLALLGATPSRFGGSVGDADESGGACHALESTQLRGSARPLDLPAYYAMAYGDGRRQAMETTQWFDTRYHFPVPEWSADVSFENGVDWLYGEVAEAQALGHRVKVALIGPLTLLYLGKLDDAPEPAQRCERQGSRHTTRQDRLKHKLDLLPRAVAAYRRVLARLQSAGVEWVQIDEPILGLDLDAQWRAAFHPVYSALNAASGSTAAPDFSVAASGAEAVPKLLLTTYFDDVAAHADLLRSLPVAGLHLDLVCAPAQLTQFAAAWPAGKVLSVGVIDGRNVWRADLDAILTRLLPLHAALGDRLWIGSSCSLLHVPVDVRSEETLDAELKSWLAFAVQKLDEIALLKRALKYGEAQDAPALAAQFAAARAALALRRTTSRVHNTLVRRRLHAVTAADGERCGDFARRSAVQQARFGLPAFPTTTIGPFPQAAAIGQAHAAYRRGAMCHLTYLEKMRDEIRTAVARQEALGLDVLVHGEPERSDVLAYFSEQLWGCASTEDGWVQRDGACSVKPPLIYGDVYRPEPMTAGWSGFAQSLTARPVKGMLTGPVTLLQRSFVRDDQPRAATALQIALALRDEVHDLEQAGIGMIQVDEPGLREGLPLKAADRPDYLDWAVRAFRIGTGGAADATQIHTHVHYPECNDILPAIVALDADVVMLDPAYPATALRHGFAQAAYPNDIGPGVYAIHAPGVPDTAAMAQWMEKVRDAMPDARLWVYSGAGLHTRDWPEAAQALANMVAAAHRLRQAAAALVRRGAAPV